jgi:hypothetical protein
MKTYAMPVRPADTDPLDLKVAWLVQTHGFDAMAGKVVVLYEPRAACMMTVQSFQLEFAAWSEMMPRMGAKGPLAPKLVLATDLWARSASRLSIAGTRMRPDRGFPVYIEDGQVFKNTYRKPVHVDDGTGEVGTFLDFLDRFIPAATDREFWLDWVSHKWRYPEVPGTGLWYIAADEDGPREGNFGTGRGMVGRILAKLFGEEYCRAEDFDILAGTSAQAVYTDWMAYCILVTVDEAHVSPTAYRRGEKRSVYTALKNCVDPAPKRRSFKVKGLPAFDGISYCSITVATNHTNAMAIPENDRRFSVLRNGRPMLPEEAVALNAWMNKPANIAALAHYLDVDLAGFNMYAPLQTEAKQRMAEQSLSEMDNILEDFAADEDRGLVFPRLFLEQAVERHLTGGGGEHRGAGNAWRGQLAGAFEEHCVTVRPDQGSKARIRINGERYRLYCFGRHAKAAAKLTETERRAEVAKWGEIDSIQTVLKTVSPGP